MRRSLTALLVLSLAACGHANETASDPDAAVTADAGGDGGLVAARPYVLKVPPSYDASKPTPLLVLLHGYGASGLLQDAYFGMTATAQAKGFLFAYADGTPDANGKRFWNATDGCCDFADTPVDDVAYLNAILDDVERKYNVDAKRVYLVGHSNGGFMAHRFACDAASRVAAIVSLAGAQWEDPSRCSPSEPVSVLQVHGDHDQVIAYDGGDTGDATHPHPYPSAHQTVATWAKKDGCTGDLNDTGETLDIDSQIAGKETKVATYGGCPAGIDVTLWTIQGGSHLPNLLPSWGETIYAFLSAHPKK